MRTRARRSSRGNAVKPSWKLGVIGGGYIAALLVASAAVGIRLAFTSGPDAQASSGMYAFGDLLLFVAVFAMAALPPTGAALFFLRPYRRVWTLLSACSLGAAVTGLAAVALFAVGRSAAASLPALDGLLVLRILVAPLLALTFFLCAIISPYRYSRLAFLAATAMETAVSAYGGFVWFVPLLFPKP